MHTSYGTRVHLILEYYYR